MEGLTVKPQIQPSCAILETRTAQGWEIGLGTEWLYAHVAHVPHPFSIGRTENFFFDL